MERYWQIAKENLKFHMPVHLLLAAALLLLSPLVLGIRNLPEADTCKVMEYYVSLLGLILLVPVFLPEQDENLRELVRAKYTSQACVYAIRLAESCCALSLLLLGYLDVLKYGDCRFPFGPVFWGSLATMVYLGGLGAAVFSFSKNLVAGYMIPIVFYIGNFGGGQKYMGIFYLFSMSLGEYGPKILLGIMGILLLAASACWKYFDKR